MKYYIHVLECNEIYGVTGVLEYPTLRHKSQVVLTDDDRNKIREIKTKIETIISSNDCPSMINSKICCNCSYYEFCYTAEG